MRSARGRSCGPGLCAFLWATFPQLPEALRLIRAWGFTYKSAAFVWLKKNRKADSWFYGLGFWTRANAEVCLLATRGRPKRQAANVHQFIISPSRPTAKSRMRRGTRSWPCWGLPLRGAVRPADNARLGRVGQRGNAQPTYGHRGQRWAGPERRQRMAYVNVPNDLSKIKTKLALEPDPPPAPVLRRRGAGGHPGLPADPERHRQYGAMFLMLAVMLPAFFLAMYERDGQPL